VQSIQFELRSTLQYTVEKIKKLSALKVLVIDTKYFVQPEDIAPV
jgi:hypothetical protein